MADDRTYIRVHDGLDENHKIEALSDAAFRLLVSSWCYCSRNLNDGRITDAAWKKRGRPRVRAELVAAGLAKQCDGYVQMHDYLQHQRSAEQVAEYRAKKRKASVAGNHKQYHVGRGVFDPNCELCPQPSPDGSDPSQVGSHLGSQMGSQRPSQIDPKRLPSTEAEADSSTHPSEGGHVPNASGTPPRFPDHCSRHASVAEPGPCGRCADVRKARAAAPEVLPDYRLRSVPDLCGQCEDRWVPVGDSYAHCPRCHPAEVRTTA